MIAMPHTDMFGQELDVGDMVACMVKNERPLILAEIIEVVPGFVRVQYQRLGVNKPEDYLAVPNDVVRAPEHYQTKE